MHRRMVDNPLSLDSLINEYLPAITKLGLGLGLEDCSQANLGVSNSGMFSTYALSMSSNVNHYMPQVLYSSTSFLL
jgi:hypothetical protein